MDRSVIIFILLYLMTGALMSYSCYTLAIQKSKDQSMWAVIGFFANIIGVLILIFSSEGEDLTKGFKICPECSKSVSHTAKVCKHCHYDFTKDEIAQPKSSVPDSDKVTYHGGTYVGNLKDGKPDGLGTLTYNDGRKYVGQWKDGKENGQGTYTWPEGDKFVGEFIEGLRHGKGIYTWPSGQKYEGEYENDAYHGKGLLVTGNMTYSGDFVNGLRHGFGKMEKTSGESYQGEFSEGRLHGQGSFTWSDGVSYTGEWVAGFKISSGVYSFPGGKLISGYWAFEDPEKDNN